MSAARNFMLLIVGSLWIAPGLGSVEAVQYPGDSNDAFPLWVAPVRRSPDAPPEPPPPLPAGAHDVAPLTLDTTLEAHDPTGETRTVQRTITRTADRVHVMVSAEVEWLFERNVRDARRVTGFEVRHPLETIIAYDESELRDVLGIQGWAQILTFGFDPGTLSDLEATGETETIGGVRFHRYRTGRPDIGTPEVWWSEEQVMPSAFIIAATAGSTRFSIENIRTGARADLLRPPASRFPDYRVVDLADWLEEGH